MKSKGFSLVELIIVIAIMAILVGVMAPLLIRYIERTNVSSDIQLCDTIKEAVNIARCDPEILMDDASAQQIAYLEDGSLYSVGYFTQQTAFTDCACDILGADIIGDTTNANVLNSRSLMKSRVAKNSGVIMMQMQGNTLYVWIDHSDKDGGNDNNTCNSYANLESSGVIFVN
ncbi:MAG: prepilin-type N-terminal cleavage/methylation domain-containing protein [Lachnospiraceae bacterium]|nr:prepilin-type N-terminal cleavage/methylation domain-containing protein [Lachnospiraceae bacterium]MBR4412529.1 prepilin-type N-terminal cleavage/methylation domain-containing protein [Lachnospiraceae bacterium]